MIAALINSLIIFTILSVAVKIHDNIENDFIKDFMPIVTCLLMGYLTTLT